MNNISIDRRFAVPRGAVRAPARIFHLPRRGAGNPGATAAPLVMRWSLDPHGGGLVACWFLSGESEDAAVPQPVRRAASWSAAPARLAA
jgi:hypothetical protein